MKRSGIILASVLVLFVIGYFIFRSMGKKSHIDAPDSPSRPVRAISYSIVSVYPHDTSHFTEGLEFYNNTLLEGTGLNERSKLIQTDYKTGSVLKEVKLDDRYFGEGISVFNDTLYQLTWQQHVVLVYNARDLTKIKELPLNGEGWGLTHDSSYLIASNGSSDLIYYEPSTFRLVKVLPIKENGSPVPNLNELEYVNGFIYANQWQYNYILKIDPVIGEVVAKMDLSDLVNKVKSADPHAMELNGIAYNPATKKFIITGKNWPQLYELQFEH